MNLLEIRFPNLETDYFCIISGSAIGCWAVDSCAISSPEPPLLLYSGWGNNSDPRRCTKGSRPLGTRLTVVTQSFQQERRP